MIEMWGLSSKRTGGMVSITDTDTDTALESALKWDAWRGRDEAELTQNCGLLINLKIS